jgi:hypothetical protein
MPPHPRLPKLDPSSVRGPTHTLRPSTNPPRTEPSPHQPDVRGAKNDPTSGMLGAVTSSHTAGCRMRRALQITNRGCALHLASESKKGVGHIGLHSITAVCGCKKCLNRACHFLVCKKSSKPVRGCKKQNMHRRHEGCFGEGGIFASHRWSISLGKTPARRRARRAKKKRRIHREKINIWRGTSFVLTPSLS